MNYAENKKHILKYQKNNIKYKSYKKNYDKEYRKNHSEYASFRSLLSQYRKEYGDDIATIKVLNWALKKSLENKICKKINKRLDTMC